jgi:glucoamylase
MEKTYFNNAIVGNSSMLGCITDRGELVRLFWPNIDYPQHIERFAAGIFFAERKHSTTWLNEDSWKKSQHYVEDTNILETVYASYENNLAVVQKDFVLPDNDVLIRHYDIENRGEQAADIGFIIYSAGISSNNALLGTLFDFEADALIHYRHNYYISISADRDVYQFQLGNNAFESAMYTELGGYESIGMMNDGAVSWKLGGINPGGKKTIKISICASHALKSLKKQIKSVEEVDSAMQLAHTKQYWLDFISNAKKVETGREDIDSLYKRSLLVFKLMSDAKTGGLLASAEVDEGFTKCGRYAYCWGRDAAFITGALDKCGMSDAVDKFYEWTVNVQDDDGSWHQRYHMDGNLAPSWGLQIDETGTIVWGILEHYKESKNRLFLEKMWNSVKIAVEFMIGFIDEETGLPCPSFDLWEERFGEHAYSAAAVYGGIMAGAKIADIIDEGKRLADRWRTAADMLKKAIEQNLWKQEWNRFIRSIRVKLNPWGEEHSNEKIMLRVNSKGYQRDLTLEDGIIDVSMLGIVVPFEVFDANDHRVKGTVEAIENNLTSHPVGGIKRYEYDSYIGGNPWILTTLWVALYHIRTRNYEKAKNYFEWALKGQTELGLLPEQISKDTGKPAWVIPLTWSHAMFVLVLFGLLEAGEL